MQFLVMINDMKKVKGVALVAGASSGARTAFWMGAKTEETAT
jgi:hypothetical protein